MSFKVITERTFHDSKKNSFIFEFTNPTLVSGITECPYQTFSLDLAYPGRKREVKQQIVQMTLNGSGMRDISRVLRVSSATVIQELKKTSAT